MATGFAAMEQAVKNISSSKGGGGGRRFSYFSLDDGDSLIVRFLTDVNEIVTCDFYEYVKTKMKDKEGKEIEGTNSFIVAPDYYADDPDNNPEDWVLKYGGKTVYNNTKDLVDPKPKERTVAIAVEREAVPVEQGEGKRPKFKYRDKLVEVSYKDKDGNEKTAMGRNYILIRKDAKTFWGGIVGYYSEFGTLCSHDFKITRVGKGLGTTYNTIPVGPEDEWDDVEAGVKELQARYGYGTGKDVDGNEITRDSDDRFLYCPQTLAEWCADQASEERIKALITGQRSNDTNGSSAVTTTISEDRPAPSWASNEADEPQSAPAAGDVADLRARLEAHK